MALRVLRTVVGAILAPIGFVLFIVGLLGVGWFVGPNDQVDIGSAELRSDGFAVVAPSNLVEYDGLTLRVHAESNQPERGIFVGAGNADDVRDHLAGAAHLTVTQASLPLELDSSEQPGAREELEPPDSLDWWELRATGDREAEIAWESGDGPYDVVVMADDGKPGLDATATVSVEIDGLFPATLIAFVVGVPLLVVGLLLVFRGRGSLAQPAGADPGQSPT